MHTRYLCAGRSRIPGRMTGALGRLPHAHTQSTRKIRVNGRAPRKTNAHDRRREAVGLTQGKGHPLIWQTLHPSGLPSPVVNGEPRRSTFDARCPTNHPRLECCIRPFGRTEPSVHPPHTTTGEKRRDTVFLPSIGRQAKNIRYLQRALTGPGATCEATPWGPWPRFFHNKFLASRSLGL
jgi:hypothetical protein